MPLSDLKVRNATPQAKPYKLTDERGMYLLVTQTGGKLWRMDYRHNGKRRTLALGAYPDVSLATARKRRDEARALLADGTDPNEHRKAAKAANDASAANTFESVARAWWVGYSTSLAETTRSKNWRFLEKDVFPAIGHTPVSQLRAPDFTALARQIERRGAADIARRVFWLCGRIMRYAVGLGVAERDVTRDVELADTLTPKITKHHAAITDPTEFTTLVRAIDGYVGTFIVRCALRLTPLVFVRPGELRKAQWADIDLEAGEWRYFVTKTKTDHIVPLSRQAAAILRQVHELTGAWRYVFPSERSRERPMSENTINAALRGLGYSGEQMTGHGFRASARKILDEVLGFRPDIIDHQLAHAVRDPNGRAYNRTAHLPERRRMMQAWADYLEGIKDGEQPPA